MKCVSDLEQPLANTSISWKFSYTTKEGLEELYTNRHLLDGQTYVEKKDLLKKSLFSRKQKVVLHHDQVANMLNWQTKPVNYKAFIAIKNDSYANLYTLLDLYLAKKISMKAPRITFSG